MVTVHVSGGVLVRPKEFITEKIPMFQAKARYHKRRGENMGVHDRTEEDKAGQKRRRGERRGKERNMERHDRTEEGKTKQDRRGEGRIGRDKEKSVLNLLQVSR